MLDYGENSMRPGHDHTINGRASFRGRKKAARAGKEGRDTCGGISNFKLNLPDMTRAQLLQTLI